MNLEQATRSLASDLAAKHREPENHPMPQKPDDDPSELAALLTAVQTEAPGAWPLFVERYERLVWSVPRRMGFSEPDCADIAQATWLLVWRHVKHVRSPQALASWLITTTAREASRFGRSMRRRDEHEGLADSGEPQLEPILPAEEVVRLEEVQLVRDSIAELSERCSKLLTQTDLKTKSYAEAAKTLKMPVGSIGPTRLRCLARLMEALSQRGVE